MTGDATQRRSDTRWSSASRSTSSSRPRRRSSAVARRISARRRTRTRVPCVSALPGALPGAQRARRRAGDPRRARARLPGAHDVDLRAKELLLSRSAEGISDLAIRSAARDERARRRSDVEQTDRRSHDRHHARAHGGGRGQVDPRSISRRRRRSISIAPAFRSSRSSASPTSAAPPRRTRIFATLKQILEYVDVSDVNMEEGSLRVDANISVAAARRDEARHEDRSEEHELVLRPSCARSRSSSRDSARWSTPAARSSSRRCSGTRTRGAGSSGAHRRKEATTIGISPSPTCRRSSFRSSASSACRHDAARAARRRAATRFAREYAALTDYDIEVLTASPAMGEYFEQVARQSGDPKTAANWMMGEVLAALNATGTVDRAFHRAPRRSRRAARTGARRRRQPQRGEAGLRARWSRRAIRPAQIAEREGLLKVSDDAALVAVDRRGVRRDPGRGAALRRRRATAAGRARRPRDEEVEGQRRPEARESVAGRRASGT